MYKIIKNACFPDLPSAKTFKQLSEICIKQFKTVKSAYAERARFYEAHQKDSESVTKWITRIKCLAMNCDFDANLDFALKDKFITGLVKGPVMERLFELKSDATLDQCMEAALTREMTLKERAALAPVQQQFHKMSSSNTSKFNPKKRKPNAAGDKRLCFACGGTEHDFKKCKYKAYKCKVCNTVGHIAAVCKNSKSKNMGKNSMNHLQIADVSDTEECDFYNIDCESENDEKFEIDLQVNGKMFTFEINSGATRSAISDKIYAQHFSSEPLRETRIVLRAYDGKLMKPLGILNATIIFNKKKIQL